MLTRRTFLTTIAAAPLAKFCKTEPVRPWKIASSGRGFIDISSGKQTWQLKCRDARFFDRLPTLPQGTLG